MQRRSTHQCNLRIDPHPEMETEFYGKGKSNQKPNQVMRPVLTSNLMIKWGQKIIFPFEPYDPLNYVALK